MWRLVKSKWLGLEAVDTVSRERVIEANDLLDAIEEAEETARRKAARK